MSDGARTELYEEILSMCMKHNMDDMDGFKNELYIIMNDFEITARTTEIALLSEDRNEQLLKKFIMSKIVKGCTDRTIEVYKKSIDFILRRIGKTADDITTDDIRFYLAVRQKVDKITRTTADNELRFLRSFFSYLAVEGIVPNNPTLKIDKIKSSTKKEKAFTEMDVEKIRAATGTNRERALVELLLSTGCRVTELVSIRLGEINGDSILVHGKGDKDRVVYINARAQLSMEYYLKERTDKNPYLFPGGCPFSSSQTMKKEKENWYMYPECVSSDRHIDKGSVEATIRKLGKRAGVENCHPHRFRRTCATFALRRGMPIEKVSMMLGHNQLTTTQIYLSIDEDELQQAHKKYVV